MMKRVSNAEFRSFIKRCEPVGQQLTETLNQLTGEHCQPGEHMAMAGLTVQLMMVSIMLGVYQYDLSIGQTPKKLGEQCNDIARQLKVLLLALADGNDDLDVSDIEAELDAEVE
jgi:hypothetical protein